MTIGASTVWRIRVSGNDANGAGYDSTISGAGTDYSQQDATQLSLTDCVSTASTTITSATGGFTSAMIGNAIRISAGTGSPTVGYYFITARTDTNTITVDRVSGTYTAGTGNVGGAAATSEAALCVDANSAGNKYVAGNTIYFRGAGTDTPSSADYTIASRLTFTGTATAPVKILGENGRPFLDSTTDITFLSSAYLYLYGLYFKASHASMQGFIHGSSVKNVFNCVFKLNNKGFPVFLSTGDNGSAMIGCEVDGQCTGAVAGNSVGTLISNGFMMHDNYIHDTGDIGVSNTGNGWIQITNNIFKKTWGAAISVSGASLNGVVSNNTIDNGQSDGIVLTAQTVVPNYAIYNNIISNCSQASKTGLKVTSGTAATSDRIATLINYNCVYNCTTSYSGISAGANDVSTDPQYTDQAGGDYRLGSASPCKGTGHPGTFLNAGNNVGYIDIGALQRQESGGGGVGGAFIHSGANRAANY